MTEAGYKRMFLWATIWNLAGGGIVPVATGWIFRSAGLPVPSPLGLLLLLDRAVPDLRPWLLLRRTATCIATGISCCWARSARAASPPSFIYNYIAYPHQVPAFFWIPVIGDLVFVVLFVMFLRFVNRGKTK